MDADTRRDLDVISPLVAQGQTLLDLVDRTRTRSGRNHLRRRLTMWTPSSSAIVALQHAHQVLAVASGTYRMILDGADIDGVERYLNVETPQVGHAGVSVRAPAAGCVREPDATGFNSPDPLENVNGIKLLGRRGEWPLLG